MVALASKIAMWESAPVISAIDEALIVDEGKGKVLNSKTADRKRKQTPC